MAPGRAKSLIGGGVLLLTNDLLRYSTDAETIKPRYLKRKYAPYYLNIAQDLINIYEAYVGKTRGELEQELDRYENTSVNYKIQRGLAKILDGFAEFETDRDFDYPRYRRKLFEAVERHRPVVRQPDLVHASTKEKVLEKIRGDIGALPRFLYGDLPEHSRLEELKRRLSPEDLVKRYNLALAQGVLYRCVYMEFTLRDSFKTVFQYLKLAQLMHRITKEREAYRIEVDGPFSLFRRTQKYGVNLARFLPGLLLAENWRMAAHINTPDGLRFFSLNHDCGLTSHYRQGNPFDSALEEAFYSGFKKRQTEWEIQRETEVLDLGDSVFIPDFICCEKIIVEIKALKELTDLHRAQVHNYLKATRFKLGLLVNFGEHPKVVYERIVR